MKRWKSLRNIFNHNKSEVKLNILFTSVEQLMKCQELKIIKTVSVHSYVNWDKTLNAWKPLQYTNDKNKE